MGYYLIDDGTQRIKSALAESGRARTPVGLSRRRVPLLAYLLPIATVATGCACGLLWQVRGESLSAAALVLLAALAFLAFSELGIHLVNWLATVLIAPKPLPRLDYSKGLPSNARSLVVVPTMLGDVDAIDRLVEGLEVRFLANRDAYLHFALLTDFLDADQQTLPGDDALVAHAARQIERLNGRYAGERGDLFFLFHRPRVW
ncbi:hypothetical protein AB4084_21950, partial [Lysobacter sp. 2RAB21]